MFEVSIGDYPIDAVAVDSLASKSCLTHWGALGTSVAPPDWHNMVVLFAVVSFTSFPCDCAFWSRGPLHKGYAPGAQFVSGSE